MADIVKKNIVMVAKKDGILYDVFENEVPFKRGDKLKGEYIKYDNFEYITVRLNGIKTSYLAEYFEDSFVVKGEKLC